MANDTPEFDFSTPMLAELPQRTAFFNGRVLSAEDLQREQEFFDASRSQLARMLGSGIARGLGVTVTDGGAGFSIESGSGITPAGQIIEIKTQAFLLKPNKETSVKQGEFVGCLAAYVNRVTANGLYLLALKPSSVRTGKAETKTGEVADCNRSVVSAAVEVQLLSLAEPSLAISTENKTYRNLVALSLLCQGPELTGWLPRKNVERLTRDHLPLAVVKLNGQTEIEFLDQHAARRRLAPLPGGPADALWPSSRRIEMEAFSQQFVAHLQELPWKVEDFFQHFHCLPPVVVWQEDKVIQEIQRRILEQLRREYAKVVSDAEFCQQLSSGLESPIVDATKAAFTWFTTQSAPVRNLVRIHEDSLEVARKQKIIEAMSHLYTRG